MCTCVLKFRDVWNGTTRASSTARSSDTQGAQAPGHNAATAPSPVGLAGARGRENLISLHAKGEPAVQRASFSAHYTTRRPTALAPHLARVTAMTRGCAEACLGFGAFATKFPRGPTTSRSNLRVGARPHEWPARARTNRDGGLARMAFVSGCRSGGAFCTYIGDYRGIPKP